MTNSKFTVLVVDDSTFNLNMLADVVDGSGHKLVLAKSGKQAFKCIELEKPDLILLDVVMPEMDGYHVCSHLKQDPKLKDIPIIFLTSRSHPEDIVKGFEVGGVDYITKPFNKVELTARINTHLSMKKAHDHIKRVNERLRQTLEELHEATLVIKRKNLLLEECNKKLEIASRVDVLTGLYNRRHIVEKIQEEIQRIKRSKSIFSLVLADIDYFKKVNDTYGHDCGDEVLRSVADCLRASVREQDVVARWGGEEFLIFLPDTEADGARILAERIRRNLTAKVTQCGRAAIETTMTFGVAEIRNNEDIDDVIKRADNALYAGKKNGRNCVIVF